MLQASKSPWHSGELTIQRSLGVADRMDTLGRNNLRNFLLDQHREFYPLLPFIALGTVDPAGDAWATLRAGRRVSSARPIPRRYRLISAAM